MIECPKFIESATLMKEKKQQKKRNYVNITTYVESLNIVKWVSRSDERNK